MRPHDLLFARRIGTISFIGSGAFLLVVGGCSKAPPLSEVDFDADYRSTYVRYLRKEYSEKKQIRIYYANRRAIQADSPTRGYLPGAKFVLEVYNAEVDANGDLARDAKGALVQGALSVVSVMHKEKGFGIRYPSAERNGDWAYSFYSPDGVEITDASAVKDCLACHKARAEGQDFVISTPELRRSFPAASK